MFNTTVIHKHDTVVQSGPKQIDVHEHRAPTDQSVKLLNEMEEKARKNIICKVQLDDNILNGVAIVYVDERWTAAKLSIVVHLRFSINGKEYFFEERYSYHDVKAPLEDIQYYCRLGLDLLQQKVASAIFTHMKLDIIGVLSGKDMQKAKDYLLKN